MQAIILAGGKGTRMKELTAEMPKPLLSVGGRNLIAWKLDALPAEVNEVIIVVSHQKEKIMAAFPGYYDAPSGRKAILFAEQKEPKGTADALWSARHLIKGPFISMMGDDIYAKEDVEQIVAEPTPWALTVCSAQSFPTTIEIVPDENGFLKDAIRDDDGTRGEIMIDVCLYKLMPEIFEASLKELVTSKELGLPQTVLPYVMSKKIPTKVLKAKGWLKVNSPSDFEAVQQLHNV